MGICPVCQGDDSDGHKHDDKATDAPAATPAGDDAAATPAEGGGEEAAAPEAAPEAPAAE